MENLGKMQTELKRPVRVTYIVFGWLLLLVAVVIVASFYRKPVADLLALLLAAGGVMVIRNRPLLRLYDQGLEKTSMFGTTTLSFADITNIGCLQMNVQFKGNAMAAVMSNLMKGDTFVLHGKQKFLPIDKEFYAAYQKEIDALLADLLPRCVERAKKIIQTTGAFAGIWINPMNLRPGEDAMLTKTGLKGKKPKFTGFEYVEIPFAEIESVNVNDGNVYRKEGKEGLLGKKPEFKAVSFMHDVVFREVAKSCGVPL